MSRLLTRFPSLAYVAPFATFMVLLALSSRTSVDLRIYSLARLAILVVVLWVFSRGVIPWRAPSWLKSVLLGVAVFVLWIAPDVLFPDWRGHWLFSNRFTGHLEGMLAPEWRNDPLILTLRTMRAVIIVPLVEELFWRGWLPRWIDNPEDFRKVDLGTFSRVAFWLTAILFASEHGAMWDVGLVAGVLYNWWMQKTRSLGDLILAHAVTNACLSAYVMIEGKWQYW
jgi:CAAX prenyl protease-like protein